MKVLLTQPLPGETNSLFNKRHLVGTVFEAIKVSNNAWVLKENTRVEIWYPIMNYEKDCFKVIEP